MLIAIVVWAKRLPSPVRYAILLVALLKFASPPFLHAPSGIFSSLEVAAVSQSDIGAFDLGPAAIAQNNFDSAFDHSSYDSDSRPLGYQEIDRNEFESQMPLAIRNGLNSPEPQDEVWSSPALSQSAPESARLSIYSWLMLVQILGSLFVVSKLLTEWTRLKQLTATANERLSSQQARLFETICQRFHFIRQPELLVSNSISADIVWMLASEGRDTGICFRQRKFCDDRDHTRVGSSESLRFLVQLDPESVAGGLVAQPGALVAERANSQSP